MNNYLGFLYLGVAIPNNLFAAFTRFLSAIAIASSSFRRLLSRLLHHISMRISVALIDSLYSFSRIFHVFLARRGLV